MHKTSAAMNHLNAPASLDWFPALAVLAVGLVLGAVLVWRVFAASRHAARTSAGVPVQVRDLEGKRDALLRQLREMEDTASKSAPEQLARERYALELDAARVLLALDERGLSANATPATRRAGVRGYLWGTGSVTALLLVGFFVVQSAKPREPGGSVTGEVPISSRGGTGEATERKEAEIQAALARNPDEVDARLALARLYAARRDWKAVATQTARVLDLAPGNPQALAYQGLLNLIAGTFIAIAVMDGIAGQNEVAVDALEKALAADPALMDGYLYLTVAYVRMGRMQDAEEAAAKASRRFPQRAGEFRRLLATLRNRDPAGRPAKP